MPIENATSTTKLVRVRDLDRLSFVDCEKMQTSLATILAERRGTEGYLLLVEHPHVITIGRSGSEAEILTDIDTLTAQDVELVKTNRGGRVTYHGPGQLVAYPILYLPAWNMTVGEYITKLEESVIKALTRFGIAGTRDPRNRGVWVGGAKIASVGIRVSRWVCTHGVAINVETDLSHFKKIVPCGLFDVQMTSIEREIRQKVGVEAIKPVFLNTFASVFACKLVLDNPL